MNMLTRREVATGLGGIVVAFTLAPRLDIVPALAQQAAPLPGSLAQNPMLDAWIRIHADGTATVCTGKVELGQGVTTALAQIAAEELELPLSRLNLISGDTERAPNEGITSGSQSIEYGGVALRIAGAQVREILLDLAAKRLGVDAGKLAVADGVIGAPDGRKVSYGELARDADLHREVDPKARPKPPSAHRIVGKSIERFDIPGKVTGGVAYVQDLRLPGMAHGRVVRPPQYGAKLNAIDEAAVKAMPGVIAVVRDGSFLGVIAEREEQSRSQRARPGRPARRSPMRPASTTISCPCRPRRPSSARSRARCPTGQRFTRRPTAGPTWPTPRSGRPARWRSSRTAR
jgi:nicotinate dehydrogenase subunit B